LPQTRQNFQFPQGVAKQVVIQYIEYLGSFSGGNSGTSVWHSGGPVNIDEIKILLISGGETL